ncbi:YciI family protein [Thalassospira sp. HF15]|uniref:YciI family protein n=1 Tax=Thalassospira sp. HF15 TaxID=2722755 RepID=UPI001430BFF0|nr:YciI family protein [Thalassospira sp. HF15]NIY75262.1 YciI family protein [Thalassospira sp. HF15]
MHFYIRCVDKPGHFDVRKANREDHLAYIKGGFTDRIVAAGPTLDPDMEGMNGSVFIIEFDSIDDAREFAANDPYAKAGLFESVVIRPFKKVF